MKEIFHNDTKSRQFKFVNRAKNQIIYLDPSLFDRLFGLPVIDFEKYYKTYLPEQLPDLQSVINSKNKLLDNIDKKIKNGS